ncbi:MAG: prenyltransferase/squalene oxidase repeat-containing protein, partial [Planctomycetota bacterium]
MALLPASAGAVNPESPEVRQVVAKGLEYLEGHTDERTGGKALIGLTFYKAARAGLCSSKHARIEEARSACRQMSGRVEEFDNYIYSKALATIFLAEVGGDRDLLARYARMMEVHRKPHGGFSYISFKTGDTSQTQYAALAYWELLNHGVRPEAEVIQGCLNWLLRTQDPTGTWGYQGKDPGSFELIDQPSDPGLSMAAAGMGGTLILANMLGIMLPPDQERIVQREIPDALVRADVGKKRNAPSLPSGDVQPQRVAQALQRGRAWFDKNFQIELSGYQCYYLYSLERYRSFEEYVDGTVIEEPDWYQKGYELLKSNQNADGSWSGQSGKPCATAFAILFLLRSTQQSIKASLGEGTLVGGRGLP